MLGEGSDRLTLGGWGSLWRGQLGQASEGGQDLGFRPSCWAGDGKLEWGWSGEWELTVPEWALSLMTSGGEWSGLPGTQIMGARRLGLWRPRESPMAVHDFHHLTGSLVERDCGGQRSPLFKHICFDLVLRLWTSGTHLACRDVGLSTWLPSAGGLGRGRGWPQPGK